MNGVVKKRVGLFKFEPYVIFGIDISVINGNKTKIKANILGKNGFVKLKKVKIGENKIEIKKNLLLSSNVISIKICAIQKVSFFIREEVSTTISGYY